MAVHYRNWQRIALQTRHILQQVGPSNLHTKAPPEGGLKDRDEAGLSQFPRIERMLGRAQA
jgi:hypothetical protein